MEDTSDYLKQHSLLQCLFGTVYVVMLFLHPETTILAPVLSTAYFIFYHLKNIANADLTVLGKLSVIPFLVTIWLATGTFPKNSTVVGVFCLDAVVSMLHCHVSIGLGAVYDRTWNIYLRKKTPEAVEAFVVLISGISFMVHDAVVTQTDASLSLFGCWYIGIVFLCLACNGDEYCHKLAIVYRVSVAIGLLYSSEILRDNVLAFRVQALIVLLGSIGPWIGIISEGFGCLLIYDATTSFLTGEENGIYNWCIFAGLGIIMGFSYLQGFLLYGEFDEVQKNLFRRLRFQDYLMAMLCVALAGALKQGNDLGKGSLGCWLATWSPLILATFSNLSKNLIRRKSGTPYHPSWWVDNTFPYHDESDLVNVTFSISTTMATAVLTILIVIALANCFGLDKMLIGGTSLSSFCIMHGFGLVAVSGVWMIFASCGLPPQGRARKFRIFPPPTEGAILACDPKNCIPPHKFDLVVGIGIVLFGTFALNSSGTILNTEQEDQAKRFICSIWVISILWKVMIHYQDYGYVSQAPNPFEEFERMDQAEKDKRVNEKVGEENPLLRK